MAFDSTNFVETKPDVFSLEGLIAWLETQDPETEYTYHATSDCLYCRYLRAMGVPAIRVGGYSYKTESGERHPLGVFADMTIEVRLPWTYGAALERALKAREP